MRPPSFVTIALAAFALTARPSEGADRHPNVLFIAVDDLNDWVGCLRGHPPGADPQYRPPRTAGNALHQCPLPGAAMQSVAFESSHRSAAVVDRHLRFGTGNSSGRLAQEQGHVAADTLRPTVTGRRPPARFFTTDRSHRPSRRREFQVWALPAACGCLREKFVHTPDDLPAMDWGVFPAERRRSGGLENRRLGDCASGRGPSGSAVFRRGRLSTCPTCLASPRRSGSTSTRSTPCAAGSEGRRPRRCAGFLVVLALEAARAPALVVEESQPMASAGQVLFGQYQLYG